MPTVPRWPETLSRPSLSIDSRAGHTVLPEARELLEGAGYRTEDAPGGFVAERGPEVLPSAVGRAVAQVLPVGQRVQVQQERAPVGHLLRVAVLRGEQDGAAADRLCGVLEALVDRLEASGSQVVVGSWGVEPVEE